MSNPDLAAIEERFYGPAVPGRRWCIVQGCGVAPGEQHRPRCPLPALLDLVREQGERIRELEDVLQAWYAHECE